MEWLSETWEWFVVNWPYIVMVVGGVVALTPTEKDDNVWARVKNVVGKYMKKNKEVS